MKKILLLLLPIFVFAQPFMVSSIPIPKNYVLNLNPYPCSEECLEQYLQNGMIFSFLANLTESDTNNPHFEEYKNLYITALNIGSIQYSGVIQIALILPYKRIGKYARTTTNAVFAYLLAKNIPFHLETILIDSESTQDIQNALNTLKDKNINFIITPFTLIGARNIEQLQTQEFTIFLPTIHKNDLPTQKQNIYFGAIDYAAQSKALIKKAKSPLIIFYDKSYTGQKLASIQEKYFLDDSYVELPKKRIYKYAIASRTTNLKAQIKRNYKLHGATVFIDTPLIKSGMIMSQLTMYDAYVHNILSTQINYNPLLLRITQYHDRKRVTIANSITEENNSIIETNALLNNDIVYDWINYATTIGIDYFIAKLTNSQREYTIPLENNQFIYPIEFKQPLLSEFKTIP